MRHSPEAFPRFFRRSLRLPPLTRPPPDLPTAAHLPRRLPYARRRHPTRTESLGCSDRPDDDEDEDDGPRVHVHARGPILQRRRQRLARRRRDKRPSTREKDKGGVSEGRKEEEEEDQRHGRRDAEGRPGEKVVCPLLGLRGREQVGGGEATRSHSAHSKISSYTSSCLPTTPRQNPCHRRVHVCAFHRRGKHGRLEAQAERAEHSRPCPVAAMLQAAVILSVRTLNRFRQFLSL